MSDSSPNLDLPLIQAAQAQKHVTHNEAVARLDVLSQLVVQGVDAVTPPDTPADGAAWLQGVGATGDWAGADGQVAMRLNAEVFAKLRNEQILIERRRLHYNTVMSQIALGSLPPAPKSIVPTDQRPTDTNFRTGPLNRGTPKIGADAEAIKEALLHKASDVRGSLSSDGFIPRFL